MAGAACFSISLETPVNMLPSRSPTHDWLTESEPLLFDDEFCQNLIKDLQSLPTPPQSPPIKAGLGKSMSNEDQLELVSELLLEDSDFFLHMNWNCDLGDDRAEYSVSDDCMWPCATEKSAEEKMTTLSTSPLLSDIDTEIFAEIVGSTLDCRGAAATCEALMQSDNLIVNTSELSETSSDYGSLSAAGESSSSDSDEEIDVVTVRRYNTFTRSQHQKDDNRCDQQQVLRRCHLEIQQQHNYAAPRPASPPPPSQSVKRSRGNMRQFTSRHVCDLEDDEERRRTHNVMERQRRNELKNCFLRLRHHVPELSNNDKASKVMILKRAKESIRNLELDEVRLSQKRGRLREKQERLKARLEQLRRL